MEAGEQGEAKLDAALAIERAWHETIMPLVGEEKRQRAGEILRETIAAYSEEGRYYHTAEHIAECLEALRPYQDRPDYHRLFLALLWHDVVYETDQENAPYNEARSAVQAVLYMCELELDGADDVARLINSTKEHKTGREDEQLVCAIDVERLAAPLEIFSAHGDAIRQEYWWVDEEVYAVARPSILRGLVEGEGPFQHPDFVHLNQVAKDNVDAEIQRLAG